MRWLKKPRGLRLHAWLLTRWLRLLLRGLAHFKVFSVTVENREAVLVPGSIMVACNHISMADPIFLWGAVRRNAIALAMAELWRWPIIGQLMWLLGQIPVKRGNRRSGDRALRRARRVLQHNGLLFIYPEGKCSRTGELLSFKNGVADLAFSEGVPVVPAGIHGSNKVWPLGSLRIHRRQQVRIRFGEAIDPRSFEGPNAKHDFLEALRASILELSTAD